MTFIAFSHAHKHHAKGQAPLDTFISYFQSPSIHTYILLLQVHCRCHAMAIDLASGLGRKYDAQRPAPVCPTRQCARLDYCPCASPRASIVPRFREHGTRVCGGISRRKQTEREREKGNARKSNNPMLIFGLLCHAFFAVLSFLSSFLFDGLHARCLPFVCRACLLQARTHARMLLCRSESNQRTKEPLSPDTQTSSKQTDKNKQPRHRVRREGKREGRRSGHR
ncbi:uncharacterized protein J3D65DRAFT_115376 [Phyllosticta citribraziliensis]|uniref:Transmembrane protein n=1 Tax=Phyllosticta citribraziliensis TaxID=989973 RepID=A0ABR1L896_9PEZI